MRDSSYSQACGPLVHLLMRISSPGVIPGRARPRSSSQSKECALTTSSMSSKDGNIGTLKLLHSTRSMMVSILTSSFQLLIQQDRSSFLISTSELRKECSMLVMLVLVNLSSSRTTSTRLTQRLL